MKSHSEESHIEEFERELKETIHTKSNLQLQALGPNENLSWDSKIVESKKMVHVNSQHINCHFVFLHSRPNDGIDSLAVKSSSTYIYIKDKNQLFYKELNKDFKEIKVPAESTSHIQKLICDTKPILLTPDDLEKVEFYADTESLHNHADEKCSFVLTDKTLAEAVADVKTDAVYICKDNAIYYCNSQRKQLIKQTISETQKRALENLLAPKISQLIPNKTTKPLTIDDLEVIKEITGHTGPVRDNTQFSLDLSQLKCNPNLPRNNGANNFAQYLQEWFHKQNDNGHVVSVSHLQEPMRINVESAVGVRIADFVDEKKGPSGYFATRATSNSEQREIHYVFALRQVNGTNEWEFCPGEEIGTVETSNKSKPTLMSDTKFLASGILDTTMNAMLESDDPEEKASAELHLKDAILLMLVPSVYTPLPIEYDALRLYENIMPKLVGLLPSPKTVTMQTVFDFNNDEKNSSLTPMTLCILIGPDKTTPVTAVWQMEVDIFAVSRVPITSNSDEEEIPKITSRAMLWYNGAPSEKYKYSMSLGKCKLHDPELKTQSIALHVHPEETQPKTLMWTVRMTGPNPKGFFKVVQGRRYLFNITFAAGSIIAQKVASEQWRPIMYIYKKSYAKSDLTTSWQFTNFSTSWLQHHESDLSAAERKDAQDFQKRLLQRSEELMKQQNQGSGKLRSSASDTPTNGSSSSSSSGSASSASPMTAASSTSSAPTGAVCVAQPTGARVAKSGSAHSHPSSMSSLPPPKDEPSAVAALSATNASVKDWIYAEARKPGYIRLNLEKTYACVVVPAVIPKQDISKDPKARTSYIKRAAKKYFKRANQVHTLIQNVTNSTPVNPNAPKLGLSDALSKQEIQNPLSEKSYQSFLSFLKATSNDQKSPSIAAMATHILQFSESENVCSEALEIENAWRINSFIDAKTEGETSFALINGRLEECKNQRNIILANYQALDKRFSMLVRNDDLICAMAKLSKEIQEYKRIQDLVQKRILIVQEKSDVTFDLTKPNSYTFAMKDKLKTHKPKNLILHLTGEEREVEEAISIIKSVTFRSLNNHTQIALNLEMKNMLTPASVEKLIALQKDTTPTPSIHLTLAPSEFKDSKEVLDLIKTLTPNKCTLLHTGKKAEEDTMLWIECNKPAKTVMNRVKIAPLEKQQNANQLFSGSSTGVPAGAAQPPLPLPVPKK